ncbi:alpha/beta hydrolase [Mycoplasmopsis equigenitalium]|uniref:Alpha/beta hydrolase n=1 Tax=Mycoplasmopsis equigenitalium TaxID=114883 RepID=A0ABY5J439_9BACT|nr:alpha/beta hydrolase [Mycoplasmopsis equigenitalium]UUD36715.1 alpha/beta hydrolase [Mycoplasmopsis equigenitalium]
MLKMFEINGQIEQIYVQDNNAKSTLVLIHGLNSSYQFVKDLYKQKLNFNLVAFNMPGSRMNLNNQNANFDEWIRYAKLVISQITNTDIYFLSHSIGGMVTPTLAKKYNAKWSFLVNPIHPYIQYSLIYKILKLAHSESSFTKNSVTSLLKLNSINNDEKRNWINIFTKQNSIWYQMIKQNVLNLEFLDKLDQMYEEIKDKSTFIASLKDSIIDGEELVRYLEETNKNYILIGESHNPFEKNCKEITKVLNAHIPFEKRKGFLWMKKKMFKLKEVKRYE